MICKYRSVETVILYEIYTFIYIYIHTHFLIYFHIQKLTGKHTNIDIWFEGLESK